MNRNNRDKIIIYSVIAAFLLAVYLALDYLPSRRLEKEHKYTIARVTDISWPSEGGPTAHIDYVVDGKRYNSIFDFNWDDKNFFVGRLLYVSFSPKDPDLCKVILDKAVTDSFPPSKGWERLP